MNLKEWITQTRIHTACLTMAGTVLPIALINNSLYHLDVLFFALWALIFHATGFTHNNVCDYKYDKVDPGKQHFPWIHDPKAYEKMKWVVYIGTLIGLYFGLWLSNGEFWSMAFLIIAIGAGYAYNYVCKKTIWSFVFITISFTSLPLFAFFSTGIPFGGVWIWVSIYAALLMTFQIAVEGELKDFLCDEANLLRSLGMRLDGITLCQSFRSMAFIWGLKVTGVAVSSIIIALNSSEMMDLAIISLAAPVALLILVVTYNMTKTQTWNRAKALREMATIEILTYWLLIISLAKLMNLDMIIAFLLFPVIWFITWNKIMWGTLVAPQV